MIKLNLLPEKVRAAERLQLILILGGLVYIVALLGVGLQYTRARAKVSAIEREVDAVNAQLHAPDLQATVDAVVKFSADKDAVQVKASIVNQYRKDQVTLVRFVDALPDWTLNGQVWYTNIEVKGDKGKRVVTMEGEAVSPSIFAKFYSSLETQPLVKSLNLESVVWNAVNRGHSVTKFKVTFSIEEYQ